ncbi:unnamed protein product [Ranitomeya imitator]|uniref:FAM124 domain-containing protein n=1 Tax=Ranitomeya imitator TaxID=111125 RepID=A0ABN9MUW4_9NEOB|nr:unnamed protein product [Ranitomeya imitator]
MRHAPLYLTWTHAFLFVALCDACVFFAASVGPRKRNKLHFFLRPIFDKKRRMRRKTQRFCVRFGELSVDDVQDPFLVSIHIIADPGESRCLQGAIDKILAWIHPDLQLFRVSERRTSKKKKLKQTFTSQPALAIILFLQEEYGEDQILHVHECFQKPPWQFYHTERVHGKFLPYMPCNQDFFTLANGTPLWAIRQVHYGKEIIRFTIYCSYENFLDMMKMYELVLKKSVWKKKADFCVFPIYSNMDIDIEFSLKRLLKGQTPVPLDSSLLEFRVKDFGQLVPLLPKQCSPISEGRWQTQDHDGNKILLQNLSPHLMAEPSSASNSRGWISDPPAAGNQQRYR